MLGCGAGGVVGPEPPLPEPGAAGTGNRHLDDPAGNLLNPVELITESLNWVMVTSETVVPGIVQKVVGSRYTLTFDKTSLEELTLITIQERDPGVIDVEFGPDGLTFDAPVLLEIDYSGTAKDRTSPDYNGLPPRLFWYNPDTKGWEVVPGTDDPATGTYRVWLKHFSRYALGSGPGEPKYPHHKRHTDEIQWY
jgi:hypothetical protein